MNIDNGVQRKVAIYIRVSTTEQKVDGYSLHSQEKKLLEYVKNSTNLNLITKREWVFTDVHTGSDINRTNFQKMMELVRKGKFDAVLVWKIDRLSRSLKHLLQTFEEFEKYNVSFISVQENLDFHGPIGKLIFQIFGALAQFERELIKGRTRMGKIASAELGNYTGASIPYGYKPVVNKSGKGKKLERIKEEQKWVKDIFNWYIFEDMGYGQIKDKLNELGINKGKYSRKRRDDSKWVEKNIRVILHNPIYKGLFIANRHDENGNILSEEDWTVVQVPRSVSDFVYFKAQEISKTRKGSFATDNIYLLRSKMVDYSIPHQKRFVGVKRSKGGISYRRKQFSKDEDYFPVFEIPGKAIEEYVWQKIMSALKDPEVFIEHYFSKNQLSEGKSNKLERELEALNHEKSSLDLEMSRVELAYERGVYDEDQLSKKLAEKNKQLVTLEQSIDQKEDEIRFIGSVGFEVEKLKEAAAQVDYELDSLSKKDKQILCDLFIDEIAMDRSRKPDSKKWDVKAEIKFRFNPDMLSMMNNKVSTAKKAKISRKPSLLMGNKVDSGAGGQD